VQGFDGFLPREKRRVRSNELVHVQEERRSIYKKKEETWHGIREKRKATPPVPLCERSDGGEQLVHFAQQKPPQVKKS